MSVPRRSALLTLMLLVAGLGACDDPITPAPQQIEPDPIVEKTAETEVLLGSDYTEGPVFIQLTMEANDSLVEKLAQAGVKAHPGFGEIVRFESWPLVSAVLPREAIDAVAHLPFVTLIESAGP